MRCYLDDLEFIERIAEANDCESVYSDDDFEYESIGEVREHRGKLVRRLDLGLRSLRESTFGNAIAGIRFADGDVTISSQYPAVLGGDLDRIIDRLRQRRIWLERTGANGLLALVAIGATSGIYVGQFVLRAAGFERGAWPLAALVGTILAFVAAFIYQVNVTGVALERSHEGGWFKRNRDTLTVNIIVAVVTALITWAVTRATTDTPSRADIAKDTSAVQSAPASRSPASP